MPFGEGPTLYKRKYPHTKGISPKHKRLVDLYFANGFNKDKAARDAGYSAYRQYSNRLFYHPDVVAEIERRRLRLEQKYKLTEDWITERLMRLADADVQLAKFQKVDEQGVAYWDFTGATQEELALIKGLQSDVEVSPEDGKAARKLKIDKPDSMRALEILARIQGMFKDKQQVEATVKVETNVSDAELARLIAFQLTKGAKASEADNGSGS
jgi:phage terminase small subunit